MKRNGAKRERQPDNKTNALLNVCDMKRRERENWLGRLGRALDIKEISN